MEFLFDAHNVFTQIHTPILHVISQSTWPTCSAFFIRFCIKEAKKRAKETNESDFIGLRSISKEMRSKQKIDLVAKL